MCVCICIYTRMHTYIYIYLEHLCLGWNLTGRIYKFYTPCKEEWTEILPHFPPIIS